MTSWWKSNCPMMGGQWCGGGQREGGRRERAAVVEREVGPAVKLDQPRRGDPGLGPRPPGCPARLPAPSGATVAEAGLERSRRPRSIPRRHPLWLSVSRVDGRGHDAGMEKAGGADTVHVQRADRSPNLELAPVELTIPVRRANRRIGLLLRAGVFRRAVRGGLCPLHPCRSVASFGVGPKAHRAGDGHPFLLHAWAGHICGRAGS